MAATRRVLVWKSSVPLKVTTSWRTGAVCQASVPPALVSWNWALTAPLLPLIRSP
jgi:hypothetical protein